MNKILRKIELKIQEFLDVPSSISFELPFLNYLQKEAKKLNYETELTNNYLAVLPKTKSKRIISAHIDRHAFIKNKEGDVEYLAFHLKNKLNIPFKFEKMDSIEKNLVETLNASNEEKSISLQNEYLVITENNKPLIKFSRTGRQSFFEKVSERHSREKIYSYDSKTGKKLNKYTLVRNDVYLDKKKVLFTPNLPLKYKDEIFAIHSNLFSNKEILSGQIDNVISAAILFELLKEEKLTSTLLFTTQEEIGNSWKCVVDFCKEELSQELLIIDTSPYPHLETHTKGFLTLREGDERSGFSKEMGEEIKEILKKMKVPYDIKPSFIGNTELGAVVQHTKGKITGTTLQLPTTNYHTSYETCTKKSLENYYKVLKELF